MSTTIVGAGGQGGVKKHLAKVAGGKREGKKKDLIPTNLEKKGGRRATLHYLNNKSEIREG